MPQDFVPLSEYEMKTLSAYNNAVWMGVVHTPEYVAAMAILQERWDHMTNEQKRYGK